MPRRRGRSGGRRLRYRADQPELHARRRGRGLILTGSGNSSAPATASTTSSSATAAPTCSTARGGADTTARRRRQRHLYRRQCRRHDRRARRRRHSTMVNSSVDLTRSRRRTSNARSVNGITTCHGTDRDQPAPATASANDTLTAMRRRHRSTAAPAPTCMTRRPGNDTYVVDKRRRVDRGRRRRHRHRDRRVVSYTLGANVENLTLIGAAAINGTGNASANIDHRQCRAPTSSTAAPAPTRLSGGGGNDTYVVDNAGDVVIEAAGGGIDTVCSHGHASRSRANVENLDLDRRGRDQRHRQRARQRAHRQRARQHPQRRRRRRHDARPGRQRHLYRRQCRRHRHRGRRRRHRHGQSRVSYTLGANVENLNLTGAAAVNGTGNDLANTITATRGANVARAARTATIHCPAAPASTTLWRRRQ